MSFSRTFDKIGNGDIGLKLKGSVNSPFFKTHNRRIAREKSVTLV